MYMYIYTTKYKCWSSVSVSSQQCFMAVLSLCPKCVLQVHLSNLFAFFYWVMCTARFSPYIRALFEPDLGHPGPVYHWPFFVSCRVHFSQGWSGSWGALHRWVYLMIGHYDAFMCVHVTEGGHSYLQVPSWMAPNLIHLVIVALPSGSPLGRARWSKVRLLSVCTSVFCFCSVKVISKHIRPHCSWWSWIQDDFYSLQIPVIMLCLAWGTSFSVLFSFLHSLQHVWNDSVLFSIVLPHGIL